MKTCSECGERVYNLGCTNCNESAYCEEQERLNDLYGYSEPWSPSAREPQSVASVALPPEGKSND